MSSVLNTRETIRFRVLETSTGERSSHWQPEHLTVLPYLNLLSFEGA